MGCRLDAPDKLALPGVDRAHTVPGLVQQFCEHRFCVESLWGIKQAGTAAQRLTVHLCGAPVPLPARLSVQGEHVPISVPFASLSVLILKCLEPKLQKAAAGVCGPLHYPLT